MSLSVHIEAFIPDTDKEFQKHKEILLVCLKNDVSLPPETAKYFGGSHPYKSMLNEKLQIDLVKNVHFTTYNEIDGYGFDVDLLKLPDGVSKLRFYYSC